MTCVVQCVNRQTLNPSGSQYNWYYHLNFRHAHFDVQLALLAGVARSALSISGIATAHWATRALLMGSMLLAISSILTSALSPGIFYIFFGEDMSNETYSDNTLNRKTTHRRLTLDDEDSRPLLHEVDRLLWRASGVRVIFSVCVTKR